MAWLPAIYVPLIAVGVGFHFGVTWVLFSGYLQKRQAGVLWWLAGWVLLTGHILAMLLTQVQGHPITTTLEHLTYLAAAYAFLAGEAGPGRTQSRLARSTQVLTALAAGVALVAVWAWPPGWQTAMTAHSAGAWAVAVAAAWSFLAAAWLARPQALVGRELAAGLLLGGYLFGGLHALDYGLFAHSAWKLPVEIISSALFSLVFAAAVTLRAWAEAREVRMLRRVMESLNRPVGGQETLESALEVVLAEFKFSQGWALVRQEGRGVVVGPWTRWAARGFPDWAVRGLEQAAFPLRVCRCLAQLSDTEITGQINVTECLQAPKWTNLRGRHLSIPLGARGAISGLMILMLPEQRRIPAAEMPLLAAIGEQVGMALDRARLYDEAKEREAARGALLVRLLTAQEEERSRIARELHDEVGQALTAIIVGLDMAARPSVADVEAMRQRLRDVKGIAEASLQEIRRVIHDLRPTVLDDLGLEEAVRWLAQRYLQPAGLQVDLEMQGLSLRLPGHLETTIFRFIQEAGTNILKHARAARVRISVRRSGAQVLIVVADDGRGLPAEETRARTSGSGLAGLRERVALLGGRLRVHSAPGGGTRLSAVLPIPDENRTPLRPAPRPRGSRTASASGGP